MSCPLLTVIIPTLQAERTLQDALDSLLAQEFRDFEVLIMDSISRDGTVTIAEVYRRKDPRVRIYSEPDKGIYDAMNKGIAQARGQWILFLGSDDRLYDKDTLAFVAALPDLEAFDVLYGNVVSPSYNGIYDGPFSFAKLLSRNMPHQAIFYRRDLFGLIGYYTIHYRGHADWDLNIRCFTDNRVRIHYIDRVVAYFGADGVSSRHDISFIKERLLPERLRLLNATPHGLRSVRTFDEWWRLLRNAGIRDKAALRALAGGQVLPGTVVNMVIWQGRLSERLLRKGIFFQVCDAHPLSSSYHNWFYIMALSIILVNFKSSHLHIDCLTEIYKDPIAASFEIIDVDNQSGDDSRERITSAFPNVKWIQLDYNSGFARANNAGMRVATGDAMLLLNGDTLPSGKDIQVCYQRLLRSEYIACGVQLLNVDGTHQITGNYVMRGGLNYLLPLPYLGSFVKWLGDLAKVKKPHVPNKVGTIEVDWINGAFLMVKRRAIDKVGMLDEDFFMYAEESEWCSRLKKIGRICLYGDIEVIHFQGATADEQFESKDKGYSNLFDRKGRQVMLSNFVRIRKQFGLCWFLVLLLLYIFDVPVFFIGMLISRLIGKAPYSWAQFGQYCKNLRIVIAKSPIIIRNKPYFYKVI